MKRLLTVVALLLGLSAPATAACTLTTGPLRLEKPRVGDTGPVFTGCITRTLDILSSSVAFAGSSPTFAQIWVSTIAGRNASGVYISSSVAFPDGSALSGVLTFRGSSTTVQNLHARYGVTAATGSFTSGLTVASFTVAASLPTFWLKGLNSDMGIKMNAWSSRPEINYTVPTSGALGLGAIDSSDLWLNASGGAITSWGLHSIRSTLALESGQAITGAATFTSSVTMKGAAGVPSLFIENPADDAQVRMCNRTYSATCANITQFSISNGGDFSLFSNGDQVFVNDFPNVYFAYAGLKFGIGTTAPDAKLDVAGDAQFGSGVAKATFSATGMLSFPAGGGVATQATFLSTVSVVGNLGLTGTGILTGNTAAAYLSLTSAGGSVLAYDAGNGKRFVSDANGAHIGGASDFALDGATSRIGIGTASPASKLHLSSGALILDGVALGATTQIVVAGSANHPKLTDSVSGSRGIWMTSTGVTMQDGCPSEVGCTATYIKVNDASDQITAGISAGTNWRITTDGIEHRDRTKLYPRTKAELLAITPDVGDLYQCSDCSDPTSSKPTVVIATAPVPGAFGTLPVGAFQ